MTRIVLSPELDFLCKSLCREALGVEDYQSLSNHDLNEISSFLIKLDPGISSSRESLLKSLQNWFQGKNTPSIAKLEAIANSLGYQSYSAFVQQNKRKIQTSKLKQSVTLNPFHKTLLFCGIALFITLFLPLLLGDNQIIAEIGLLKVGDKLLASIIQAIVVILFYVITRFSNFGGRDRILDSNTNRPVEVNKSLGQFLKGWELLWLSFSVLYIWFCIMYGTGLYIYAHAQSISDIITILSSLCFAWLFSVMDVESIPRNHSPKRVNTFHRYLIFFTIGLSFSSMMSILDRYYNLGFLDGAGTYLLGYTNVLVMLYFFGRLESHYLNVNRFVLLPLYTYAIIQIAYVLFFEATSGEPSFEAYVIGAVLILKGFLYFLIREWIKEGKLENYFLKQHERLGSF